MCGIAGFTHESRSVDVRLIERMTAALIHRGPDYQDVFSSSEVSIGAVRLAVVDPASGAQPLRSQDGCAVVAFNGEIYNHRELRRELETLGARFRSHCDTEVVLEAYLQWGTDCFPRFRGMFAIAIWNATDQKLILARDRVGIKPLYFSHHRGEMYFGSEMKALFAHPAITRILDEQALEDYLSLNYVPGPRTLIRGIEKLPPGHYLEWRHGISRIRRYWSIETKPDSTWSIESASEQLDHLLQSSVREQLIADRPLGIWSSGGLDSATVLHYASEASGKPLDTFSIGFSTPCCDESKYFREVARRYGSRHHEMQLEPGDELVSAIEDFAHFSDEPNADAGALPVWFLSKMTAQHATVALSGDGGDELFGGYLTYMADRVARPLRYLPSAVRRASLFAIHKGVPCSAKKISFEYKLKRLLDGSLLSADEAHLFWNGSFTPRQKSALLGRSSDTPYLAFGLPKNSQIGALNRFMIHDQQVYLPDNILAKVDRMSMAHSLEVRPPLLDHRIVEFAATLPQHLKIRGMKQKVILRRLMENKLPESVLQRSKTGFDIPAHNWFRGFLRPFLHQTINRQSMSEFGLFNFDATESLIQDHMDRRINAGYQLWGLLTLFLWLKKWNVTAAQAREYSKDSSAPEVLAMN